MKVLRVLTLSLVCLVLLASTVAATQIKLRPGEYIPPDQKPLVVSTVPKISPIYYAVLLSDTVFEPWGVGVTVSGDQVFVNSPYNYEIYRYEAGSTSVFIETDTEPSAGKWRGDIGLFFGDNTGTVFHLILSAPIHGTHASVLKTVGSTGAYPNIYPDITALEVDPVTGTIYFFDQYSGNLYRLPNFDGHTPQLLATLPVRTFGLAIKGDYLYYGDIDGGTIYRMPKAGGPSAVFATGLNGPAGLEFDKKGNLYIAEYRNGSVAQIKNGTRTVQRIASGFVAPFYVAVDGKGNVYFTDYLTSSLWMLTRKVVI